MPNRPTGVAALCCGGAGRRLLFRDVPPLCAFRRLAAVAARAFRVAERQPHLEGEIGAQEVRHVGAIGLNDEPLLILAQAQMIEQEVARRIAQHLMHRLPRRRFIERRVEQCLDPCGVQIFRLAIPGLLCGPHALARARARGLFTLHDDFARDRLAFGGCAIAHEYRLPVSSAGDATSANQK